jgi:hypothetical protein
MVFDLANTVQYVLTHDNLVVTMSSPLNDDFITKENSTRVGPTMFWICGHPVNQCKCHRPRQCPDTVSTVNGQKMTSSLDRLIINSSPMVN